MSHIIRSICIEPTPKESGSPIVALIGSYSNLLHLIHISKNERKDNVNLQANEFSATSPDFSSIGRSILPHIEQYTESMESMESVESNESCLSSVNDQNSDSRVSVEMNEVAIVPKEESKEKGNSKFRVDLIQTIKPSVSKIKAAPVALALDGNEIFLAEHVKTRVLNSESNLSSRSPFLTTSSLSRLSGEDFEIRRNIQSDIQKAIVNLEVTKNYLIVVFDNSIQVLKRKNFSVITEITTQNSLYSVSYENDILAYQEQGQSQGCISIQNLGEGTVTHINGHKQKVMRFCLNRLGTLLASTSKYATLVKVFNVETQQKLKEMRRGYKSAIIYNMVFSDDSIVLAAFSSSGLHLFSMGQTEALKNTFSSLYALSYIGVSAYGNEWAAKKDSRFANMLGCAVFEPSSHTNIHFLSSLGDHYAISFEDVSDNKAGSPTISKKPLYEVFDSNERRLEQTQKMKKKFPDRLPLLVTPRRISQPETPILCRNKMMIPTHMNCDQLKEVIGRQLRRLDDTVRIWIGGSIRNGHIQVNHLYEKYADKNGFLLIEYDFIEK